MRIIFSGSGEHDRWREHCQVVSISRFPAYAEYLDRAAGNWEEHVDPKDSERRNLHSASSSKYQSVLRLTLSVICKVQHSVSWLGVFQLKV